MSITTISSRAFNQDTSRAKKAAANGPVFITDRGKPAHVLLSIAEYHRLKVPQRSIIEALSMPGLSEIDVEFPRLGEVARPVEF